MKLDYRISQINADCVRVQIACAPQKMKGSALNRYGFIFEDEVRRHEESVLNLTLQDSEKGCISATDNSGFEYFRMINVACSEEGALVEFEIFDDEEDYIGFGDLTRNRIYHRGYKANCNVSNVASYIPVPFFMSTRGYAVMVNSTHQVIFDMGCTDKNKLCWFDKSGIIDFYVWRGNNFKDLIDFYTQLTGRPELPPKWSFGLWYICRTECRTNELQRTSISDTRTHIVMSPTVFIITYTLHYCIKIR